MATVQGIVVEADPGPLFIAAEQALACVESPRLSPVPGASFSILWFEGQVLVTVPLTDCLPEALVTAASPAGSDEGRRSKVLICEIEGERYALTNMEPVTSGRFEIGDASPETGRATVRYPGGEAVLCTLTVPREPRPSL